MEGARAFHGELVEVAGNIASVEMFISPVGNHLTLVNISSTRIQYHKDLQDSNFAHCVHVSASFAPHANHVLTARPCIGSLPASLGESGL